MSFPTYAEYKDSEVEWIGNLPSHWTSNQIKRNTYLKARVGWKGLTSDEFQEIAYAYLITGTDFRKKFVKWDQCYQVDEERYKDDPFIQLQNGDLLITKDGTIGKLAIVSDLDKPACLNSGIFVVRPTREYTTEFLYWVLSSDVFSVFCDLESFGSTINHLYQNVFERFDFPIPPLPEQRSIASFLDTETSKIDGLVSEQRRLIELLQEKRQAVISHAVTKGLNPDVRMKPSGIQWLGDVPEHWEVIKGGLIGTLFGSESVKDDQVCQEGNLPFIKVGSMNNDTFKIRAWDWFVDPVVEKNYRTRSDFVVFPKRGAAIFLNKVNVVDRPSLIDPNLMGWEINERAESYFIAYLLKTRKLEELADVSTVPQINNKHIAPERFPVPPVSEQKDIVAYLNAETTKIDSLVTQAERGIELLQERRTALISAAVTGKIDVRGYNPEEAAV